MSHTKGIAQVREVGAEGEERTCKALAHVPAGEGTRSLWVFGELVPHKIPSRRTGGAYSLFEVATRPGAGPPPHVNHREDESFYVLEGEYEFLVDERNVMARAGSPYVPAGKVITDQADADDLPKVEEVGEVDKYYQEALLDIHDELTQGYIELYEKEGYEGLLEVGPNPKTSFNPKQIEPKMGQNVGLDEFVRVVGDVPIGDNSYVGRRTAIRADEGAPIVIGPGSSIDDRVTFHAVEGSDVRAGKFLVASDDCVLHGPLKMGKRVFVGEHAFVFRARLGDDVQIGQGAAIVGPQGPGDKIMEIPDDTLVPAGAVVTSEKDVRALQGG